MRKLDMNDSTMLHALSGTVPIFEEGVREFLDMWGNKGIREMASEYGLTDKQTQFVENLYLCHIRHKSEEHFDKKYACIDLLTGEITLTKAGKASLRGMIKRNPNVRLMLPKRFVSIERSEMS